MQDGRRYPKYHLSVLECVNGVERCAVNAMLMVDTCAVLTKMELAVLAHAIAAQNMRRALNRGVIMKKLATH